jgi:hypothetical protein
MQTPALKHLMSGYFHQDFGLVHGSPSDTVSAFARDSPEEAADLPEEIAWVLAEFQVEDQVERYLDQLGCEYFASPDDGGYRGWLAAIAEQVRTATAKE